MQIINIDPTELKAIRHFESVKDVRYYLNGVLVQASAKSTRLVATDGTVLGVFDHHFDNDGIEFEEFIVPNDALDRLKPDPRHGPVQVVIGNGDFELRQLDSRVLFKPVDGKFPDYPRVIPEKVSGEPANFDGDILGRIHKAQRLFSKKLSAIIWHGGVGSSMFQLQNAGNFIGVLMPMRMTNAGEPPLEAPNTSYFRAPVFGVKQKAAA